MSCRAIRSKPITAFVWVRFVGMVAAWLVSLPALGKEAPDSTTAAGLVAEAHEAELAGDMSRYFALLRQAVRVAPEYELARWHLGQMQIGGKWLAIEEAQRRAAADPKQEKYRELRTSYGDSPAGQLALARWCRKNNFHDEARLHWASVLSFDPHNEDAQRALGMRWHGGKLLTFTQIEQSRRQARDARRALDRWKPQVAQWDRASTGRSKIPAETALGEIRSLTDPEAIPAFEEITLDDTSNAKKTEQRRQISLAFMLALGQMSDLDASESLARHAVLAPLPDVRTTAIGQLRKRPMHDYMPLMLSALMPAIESWFHITAGSDGSVHYRHVLYREGSEAAQKLYLSRSALQFDHRAPTFSFNRDGTIRNLGVRESDASVGVKMAHVAASNESRFASEAMQIELAVARQNDAIAARNERITQALAGITGENFGNEPMAWAEWWTNYNEYYSEGEPPTYDQHYIDNRYYYYRLPEVVRQTSCFAKGTTVWTKSGQKPIESLELGDLVLSQNVETGELSYQPVIGRTVRPPSEILKISWVGEKLRTTRGHPFWVAGVGWRMAKELDDGAILHGVTSSPRIEAVETDGKEEAYNLVVAEFNTYFVGETGVLVHDNTPRRPTRASVPGLAAK